VTPQTMSLFDLSAADVLADTPAPVGRTCPDTSAAAAAGVRTGSQKGRVLAALAAAGDRGCTDFEAARAIGHPRPHVVGTRRLELQRLGLVEATGMRRPSDLGGAAVVYVATDAGRAISQEIR
jgi:hypothetical protein